MQYDWIGMYDQVMYYVQMITFVTIALLILGIFFAWMAHTSMTKYLLPLILLLIVGGILESFGIAVLPDDILMEFFGDMMGLAEKSPELSQMLQKLLGPDQKHK